MPSCLRVTLVLAMVVLCAVPPSSAQEGLTKRDGRGPVTVTVTLMAAPAAGGPITVKVGLDTHSVGLDEIAFDKVVVMRTPEGADIAPTAVEQLQGAGHHRSAVVVFRSLAFAGPLKIVVKDVGGVAQRSFVWGE